GSYAVTFLGTEDTGGAGTATTTIVVNPVNRAPVVLAGGPYQGIVNTPVNFDGRGSFDPDGDPLIDTWDFGDGDFGTGATPSHTYTSTAGSPYTVTLKESDGSLSSVGTTTATIVETVAANAFYPLNLNYVFPQILPTLVWIEPINGSFNVNDVVLTSISMGYNGKTIVTTGKNTVGGDGNHNGTREIRVCFARNDLNTLFANVPNGTNSVTLSLQGGLMTGGAFHGDVAVKVVKFGWLHAGSLASVSPNPLNPQATLTFVTTQPGMASVRVFDVSGRLVRNVMTQEYVMPGVHEVTVDGRNDQGNRLASGIYFYRVESAEGISKGSLVVMK
ncbi:MAG: PKD domain-containing protein, partial [Candidatus Eiseniibacteriota bacterium]